MEVCRIRLPYLQDCDKLIELDLQNVMHLLNAAAPCQGLLGSPPQSLCMMERAGRMWEFYEQC